MILVVFMLQIPKCAKTASKTQEQHQCMQCRSVPTFPWLENYRASLIIRDTGFIHFTERISDFAHSYCRKLLLERHTASVRVYIVCRSYPTVILLSSYGHPTIILWSSYCDLTAVLRSSYCHFTAILSSYCNLTVFLLPSYYHPTVILLSFCGHPTVILLSSYSHLTIILLSSYCHPTIIL